MDNLHPAIQELLDIATDGLSLFESARLRKIMIERIQEASLCGAITLMTVNEICQQVLISDISRLFTLLNTIDELTEVLEGD